jgi:isocitrate dehydrogenase (NAD+)
MLGHMHLEDQAERIRAALRATLAAGDRTTPDVGGSGTTASFADALVEHLPAPA